jgi:PAS domain S-box-containing protein
MPSLFSRPNHEQERLASLGRYHIVDTPSEPAFDLLTSLAAEVCNVPIALITLIDAHRQWFKSKVGLDISETPREIAFCNFTISDREFFEVPDATLDPRFANNPLVTGEPRLRSYAGVPLISPEGQAIGSFAVLDRVPRQLQSGQRAALKLLAELAMLHLQIHRRGWESSAKFGTLVDAAPLPIVVFDATGAVQSWNPAAEAVFGWHREEVLGKPNPILSPEEHDQYTEHFQQVLQGAAVLNRELQVHRKDGQTAEVSFSAAPIRAHTGKITGAVAMFQDVAERNRAAQALRHSLSLLEATFEATADGILVVDSQGRIQSYNRRFLEIWKVPAEPSLGGRAHLDALRSRLGSLIADSERFINETAAVYSSPEKESFNMLEFTDGRMIERYSKPQVFGGKISGRVWSYRDITNRIELERQLQQAQKLEALGSLSAGIAHDFNNLLNVILGYTALLRDKIAGDAIGNEYAGRIQGAARRAAALTRQLQAFGRKQFLRPQIVDVNQLVTEMYQLISRIIPEDIELRVDLAPTTLLVKADPGRIEQVLMNLVVNARDAMPHGGTLLLRTRQMERIREAGISTQQDTNFVELAVVDTGVGIKPEHLPRIFEPFFTTKEVGKGTGLGLATVYGIVQQSGGHVAANSKIGEGTTMSVLLPGIVDGKPRQVTAATRTDICGDETILVVEDNSDVRALIRDILKSKGFHVLEAESPTKALQVSRAHQQKIHLLLTDIIMPEMRGGELAMRVAADRPEMKLLFMSGYAENEFADDYSRSNLIEKPFSAEELLVRVRSTLDERSSSTDAG